MNNLFVRRIALLAALFLPATMLTAAEPEAILLWPNGAPGSEGQTAPEKVEAPIPSRDYSRITSVHKPSITPYLPAADKATGAGVVICPGGGHSFLAWDIEGENVGKWLAAHGIAGFVLKYRLARATNSPYQVEVHALMDAQRAIRLVRSRAQEWNLNPDRIGVMGFSAGGQLAALAAARYDSPVTNGPEALDKLSCKPDFQALIYPAIPTNLVPTKELTPPAFLACGEDDRTNISVGLARLYISMKQAGVVAELHEYLFKVGHGFGIRPAKHNPVDEWPERFTEWLDYCGFLKKP